jgi:RNA polymerase sigma-70 factor (ECF subfamily)
MKILMSEHGNKTPLVELARQGNRAAFDELISLTRERLIGFIRFQLGNRLRQKVEFEDVLQEVLLCAYQSVGEFQGQDNQAFRRWLEGIARNIVRNLARRRGWKLELEISQELPGSNVSPSRNQRRQERFERLSKAVEGLSPDYRTVIQLSRIEGLKIREIADRMNRSHSAVKNLLLRAMRELKKSFGDTESLSLPQKRLEEEGESHGD